MLGRGVAQRLEQVEPRRLWSEELIELCAECDAVVCNLECCVSDRGAETDRVAGKPFFFRAPPAATGALTAIGVRGVSLANNHALDYETEALEDTLAHVTAAGLETAGAGASGAGLPEWVLEELVRLRGEADVVAAFPHWGPNMTTEPARWQRRRARDLLEGGADIVAGHSAHVFHGIEIAEGRPVLYDLGDALDDYAVDDDLRNDLGILALWSPGADPAIEVVGLRLGFCETAVAEGADAEWIAERMRRACSRLGATAERVSEARLRVG